MGRAGQSQAPLSCAAQGRPTSQVTSARTLGLTITTLCRTAMRIATLITLAAAISIGRPAVAQEATVEGLTKRCNAKTLVFSREGEKVGEKLGDYCAAYLVGVLDTLRHAQKTTCREGLERSPEYLWSVFEIYVRDRKVPASESAAKTALQAFRRAFNCPSAS